MVGTSVPARFPSYNYYRALLKFQPCLNQPSLTVTESSRFIIQVICLGVWIR